MNLSMIFLFVFGFGNQRKSGLSNFHFVSSVVVTASRNVTNSIGARLSPCLTPHVDLNIDSTFSIFRLIVVSLYRFFKTCMTLFGMPRFARMSQIIYLFTVSYAFTKSTNMAYTGFSYSRRVFNAMFTAKFESWHPLCLIDPH